MPETVKQGELSMKMVKRRIFSGAICEQLVYLVPDAVRNIKDYEPRPPRFKTEADRQKHKTGISRRRHNRLFNANFTYRSLFSTLTFDDANEIYTFSEAKRIRDNFMRTLKRKYPDAVIFFYIGRGRSAHRIHFHMVSDGIPQEFIIEKWKYGKVVRINNLRKHNYYDGVDHGQDFTKLANYLFNHWTPEQGGHHWKMTKNAKKPDKEDVAEVKIRGGYSEKRPPRAPKGYRLVEVETTKYGYQYYKYIVEPEKKTRKQADRLVS